MLDYLFPPKPYFNKLNARLASLFSLIFLAILIVGSSAESRSFSPGNDMSAIEAKEPKVSPEKRNKSIKDFFLFGDYIHKNNIKTVLFNRKGFEMTPPLIRMESGEKLVLRFDDLDADYKNYYYTIIHCDAHWQPSPIEQYEYIEGFYEEQIREYSYSINTRVPFTHYRLEIPSPDLRPTKSGNYILKVFLNGDRENVVLTRRFMIFEQQIQIEGQVRQAELVRYRDTKQQLNFAINSPNYRIDNPFQDLRVVITQNGRWDNAIKDLPPRSVRGNQLIYDYDEETLFEAGNEFREFDIRSLRHLSARLADITTSPRHNDVFLLPDQIRKYRRYTSREDINGRFQVKTFDANDNMLEADYAHVHFRLPMETPLASGGIYVLGELTDWRFSEENKMSYNYPEKEYELELLLKQGYYNYHYAFLDEGETAATVDLIEGSHFETENDYSIFVYHRRPGSLYDRLIGIKHLNSSLPR